MIGRMYTAGFQNVSISVATDDVFELAAPSDAVVILYSCYVGQRSSETSDAIAVSIQRATTSGSGGTVVTPNPHNVGDPAFGGVCERNNTTQATTLVLLPADGFNVLSGWQYRPIPDERIVISPSGILVFRFEDAPASSTNFEFSITFVEIGG